VGVSDDHLNVRRVPILKKKASDQQSWLILKANSTTQGIMNDIQHNKKKMLMLLPK
jgi:hypothetical protein